MTGLPILVHGAGVRALVVGGGSVALRKARALADAGADVRVIAPGICEELHALARDGAVTLVERPFAAGDIADAQLVIAATDDRATNTSVCAQAHAAHRLVNVVDAPDEGSFATMATHRSGALVIGVSAGGVPNAAARLRDAIALRFDGRYARALASLGTLRRTLIDGGDSPRWRGLATELVGDDFCAQVESGALEQRVRSWR